VCTGGDAATLEALATDLLAHPAEMAQARDRGQALSERLFSSAAAVRQIVAALDPAVCKATKPLEVLMVNQVFWPDVAATAQHGHDLAKYLVQRGDSVTALASRSIYGESGVTLQASDSVDGIRIVRVAKSAFGKNRIAGRVFDFLAFYSAALSKALWIRRPDVVICFTTPPFIGLVGLLLKWCRGTRFAFWAMDLYPEVPVVAGQPVLWCARSILHATRRPRGGAGPLHARAGHPARRGASPHRDDQRVGGSGRDHRCGASGQSTSRRMGGG
jgi:hypothetical protein